MILFGKCFLPCLRKYSTARRRPTIHFNHFSCILLSYVELQKKKHTKHLQIVNAYTQLKKYPCAVSIPLQLYNVVKFQQKKQ